MLVAESDTDEVSQFSARQSGGVLPSEPRSSATSEVEIELVSSSRALA